MPERADLQLIYGQILSAHLGGFGRDRSLFDKIQTPSNESSVLVVLPPMLNRTGIFHLVLFPT